MASNLELEHAAERKVNPVPRRLADTRKAKEMLGFEAMTSFDEGLRTLVAWWQTERASVTP
jgi:UDP-glucose 4-epimerase